MLLKQKMDQFAISSQEVGIETAVFYTSVCSIVGAWLGAVPIPLDWDRPWQVGT